jgi:hypothetical protein
MKWHPGHYVMLATEDSLTAHLRNINEIGNEPSIKGIQLRIRWPDIETSRGVYDFSKIDAVLRRLKAQPTDKRLVVRVIDRSFKTTSRNGIVPSYMQSWGLVETQTGFAARLWEPAVMSRLIELYKRIGWRYERDDHFIGIASEETTLGLDQPFPSGYSHEALTRQYIRMVKAVRPAMPTSNLFIYTNWIGSSALMGDLIQSFVEPRVSAGGSNILPGRLTLGQRVFTGVYGADYRWTLPFSSSVEGGELKNHTPREIADWAYREVHAHYMFWVRNTWAGPASSRWHTGILPFLRTNPRIRTRCPDAYGICAR